MSQSKMKTIAVTGSQGFICGYLCKELLSNGYRVIGYDNYSKYGRVARAHDNHPNFKLVEFDLAKSTPDFEYFAPDYIILGAALIGGIATFHKYAFDLIMQNELIMANSYKSILNMDYVPERVVTISSSMVFEGADIEADKLSDIYDKDMLDRVCNNIIWPTHESYVKTFPPPQSTYGAQKLMTEYWARGAWEQYKIPYTIVRPFNCVGLGELASTFDAKVMSGNVKLLMSHVLPDLVHKCLSGQKPLRVLGDGNQIRCYTHGKDIARGIRLAMESPAGINNDYNISTPRATTVKELAELVWKEVHGTLDEFALESDEPFFYDVQKRVPYVGKAEDQLGFKAEVSLEESVSELVNHMRKDYASLK